MHGNIFVNFKKDQQNLVNNVDTEDFDDGHIDNEGLVDKDLEDDYLLTPHPP